MTLEEILADLAYYGRPSLSMHEDGWHCRINVFVTGDGVEFKVSSTFTEPTAHAAASECYCRLHDVIRDVKGLGKPPGG